MKIYPVGDAAFAVTAKSMDKDLGDRLRWEIGEALELLSVVNGEDINDSPLFVFPDENISVFSLKRVLLDENAEVQIKAATSLFRLGQGAKLIKRMKKSRWVDRAKNLFGMNQNDPGVFPIAVGAVRFSMEQCLHDILMRTQSFSVSGSAVPTWQEETEELLF
ncbi:MAG: hypothetical protein ABIE74_03665 [Pseudomonadota bacterium]